MLPKFNFMRIFLCLLTTTIQRVCNSGANFANFSAIRPSISIAIFLVILHIFSIFSAQFLRGIYSIGVCISDSLYSSFDSI